MGSEQSRQQGPTSMVVASGVNEPPGPVVVFLGAIGCGKSSLGNFLLKHIHFKTSSSAQSVTKECDMEYSMCEGFGVVDTPGFSDTALNEDQVLEKLQTFLAQNLVSCVVVILDANTIRMDKRTHDLLALASLAAPHDDNHRIGIVFNKFSHNENSESIRQVMFEDDLSLKANDNETSESIRQVIFKDDLSLKANDVLHVEEPMNFAASEAEQAKAEFVVEQAKAERSLVRWKSRGPLMKRVMECLANKLVSKDKNVQVLDECVFFLDSFHARVKSSDDEASTEAEHQFEKFRTWVKSQPLAQFHIPEELRMQGVQDAVKEKIQSLATHEFLGVKEKLYRLQSEYANREITREKNKGFSDADLCGFSEKIYEKQDEFFEKYQGEVTIDTEHWFSPNNAGPTYVILKRGNSVCVVFKGTEGDRIDEIISNMNVKCNEIQVSSDGSSRLWAHSGFSSILGQRDGRGTTWHERIFQQLCAAVQSLGNSVDGSSRLVYTGHSLGGALAMVCRAFHLKQYAGSVIGDRSSNRSIVIETVTFGAPLVFTEDTSPNIRDQLAENSRHYVFGSDIVPRLLRWRHNKKQVTHKKARDFLVASHEATVVKQNVAICGFSGTGAVACVVGKFALEAVFGTAALPIGLLLTAVPASMVIWRWAKINEVLSVKLVKTFMTEMECANYVPIGKTIELVVWTPLDKIPIAESNSAIKHHAPKEYTHILNILHQKTKAREYVTSIKSKEGLYKYLEINPF